MKPHTQRCDQEKIHHVQGAASSLLGIDYRIW